MHLQGEQRSTLVARARGACVKYDWLGQFKDMHDRGCSTKPQ